MTEICNGNQNNWKVTLLKTIDHSIPVYYRLVNLDTFDIREIPAYRIFDSIVNENMTIVNATCKDNRLIITDDEGYESTADIIVIDEFDNEVPNIYEWTLQHTKIGSAITNRFNNEKNKKSISDYKITSKKKLAWTCKKGHTIYCGFPTYYSLKCICPMCQMKNSNTVPSFKYWANMMNRPDLIDAYNSCPENTTPSCEIAYNSKKKVKLLLKDHTAEEITSNLSKDELEQLYVTDGQTPESKIEICEPLCKITKGIMTGEGLSEQLESRMIVHEDTTQDQE
jgi:hypothetical protein